MSTPPNKKLIRAINNALNAMTIKYSPNKPSPSGNLPRSPTLVAARRNAVGYAPRKLKFNNKK